MAGAGVGLFTFFFLYNEYERFRHYTTDEECGSAAFNDMGKDMIKFSMEYAEPFGKKEGDGASNMICASMSVSQQTSGTPGSMQTVPCSDRQVPVNLFGL